MNADELLRDYVLQQFRKEYYNEAQPRQLHLLECQETVVREADGTDGVYGCDTGCEYLRLECIMGCPHGEDIAYEYGEFGDIAFLIQGLEQLSREKGTT